MKILNCATATLAACVLVTGCQTNSPNEPVFQSHEFEAVKSALKEDLNVRSALLLREADVVRITFPSAPNLNTTQQIRRDGKLNLQLIGEITAVGMTPAQLEAEILKQYAPQLVSKEINVTVESSAFPIYVTGAVLRPGKIICDHPLTALEAIMEAGLDHAKANLKSVMIIREGEGQNHRLNLKLPLQNKKSEPFMLKPGDIIYVPEKFSWF